MATDPKSSTISTTFTIFIEKNKPPLAVELIDKIEVFMFLYFQVQIPDTVFREEDNDPLTYQLVPYEEGGAIPPWITFIEANRTILGIPKDRQGDTFKFKVFVNDGRKGSVYQIVYMTVNPNYTLSKLVPLVIIGILPMIAMFIFVFTLGFAKVPAMPAEEMLEKKEKPDFDSYRFILD